MQDNYTIILAVIFVVVAIFVSFSNMKKGREKRKNIMTDDELLIQKIQENKKTEEGKK